MSMVVEWRVPPSVISRGLDAYEQRLMEAIGILADAIAQGMQGQAQSGAPWNDVTGAARQGLRGWAVKAATEVVMYLAHSVEYGPYLELGTSKMAPRPIILPVLQANYPEVMAQVRALVGA